MTDFMIHVERTGTYASLRIRAEQLEIGQACGRLANRGLLKAIPSMAAEPKEPHTKRCEALSGMPKYVQLRSSDGGGLQYAEALASKSPSA